VDSLGAVRQVIQETLDSERVSGLALAVARGDGGVDRLFVGQDGAGEPLGSETLFAIASITKLATALAVLRLLERGVLGLDDPLAQHLPEAVAAQEGVTLRSLLSHTSGLPHEIPQAPAYQPGLNWAGLALACLSTPLASGPLERVQYSNPGYGLLAIVVERQTGQRFADALGSLVLEPLGIEGYLGAEPPRPPAVVEDVRSRHRGSPLEPYNSPFWRLLGLPWGGLLTTLDGALALVQAFAGQAPGLLQPATLAEARRNQAVNPITGQTLSGGPGRPLFWEECPWGLGPELRDAKSPHWAPAEADPASYGHAGASGCIAWHDPSADLSWCIVGTRTADGGWLVRGAPNIAAALLRSN
jgi:CubicO group peptidase (beta-lactamase class C family)